MPSTTRTAFADRLRVELDASRLSQASLADRVGVSQQTVSKWLAAETQPRFKVVPQLARALGVAAAELSATLVSTDEDPASADRLNELRIAALERRIHELGPDQLERLEAYVHGLLDGAP